MAGERAAASAQRIAQPAQHHPQVLQPGRDEECSTDELEHKSRNVLRNPHCRRFLATVKQHPVAHDVVQADRFVDHHAARFQPCRTHCVADAVAHAGVADAEESEAAMAGAEAPFHVDVVDEQALVHAADLCQCVQWQQAARGDQKIAVDALARRAEQLAVERKADLDERCDMAVSPVAELWPNGPDRLGPGEVFASGFERRNHAQIEKAVLVQQQQIGKTGRSCVFGGAVHGGAQPDVGR